MIFKLQKTDNKVKRVIFTTSPTEALVIIGALNNLVNDEDTQDIDKQTAKRLLKEITREHKR